MFKRAGLPRFRSQNLIDKAMKTLLKTRTSRHWALALLLATVTFAVAAHAGLTSIGEGNVRFKAVGPAGLKIDGRGKRIKVSESDGKIKLKVPLSSLKTGIKLRDKHLKDALQVSKHPKAKLVVKRSALNFPDDKKSVKGSAVGRMTLNGTTKRLKFNYRVKRTGSDYHVKGVAELDITKFNLEKPCYLGVCVEKDVKIHVKFKLRDQ